MYTYASARTIAGAAVLIGDGIAVLDEISGDLRPRPRPRNRSGTLGSTRRRFVVGRAFEEHRKRPRPVRPVDIGRQHHPVARWHHPIALDNHPAHVRHPPSARTITNRDTS